MKPAPLLRVERRNISTIWPPREHANQTSRAKAKKKMPLAAVMIDCLTKPRVTRILEIRHMLLISYVDGMAYHFLIIKCAINICLAVIFSQMIDGCNKPSTLISECRPNCLLEIGCGIELIGIGLFHRADALAISRTRSSRK